MRTAAAVEQVDDRHRLVHADRPFQCGIDVAANKRKMVASLNLSRNAIKRKSPAIVRIGRSPDALDQAFMLAAVVDQVRDGTDFQRVIARELDEIGQARHRTVIVHDLAQNRGG